METNALTCEMDFLQKAENRKQLLSFIEQTELKGGELAQLFSEGTIAAILSKDERVQKLFKSILEWLGLANTDRKGNDSRFGNLLDLARNYRARNATGGDTLTFQPGFLSICPGNSWYTRVSISHFRLFQIISA
jgi:hypothetical protein